MNEYAFIDKYGIDRAKKVVENVVFNAEYYSEKTGSYYSSNKNDSINIKKLRRAIKEFDECMLARERSEKLICEWQSKSLKD